MSYFISSRLQDEPIDDALQHQDGIHLPPGVIARPEVALPGAADPGAHSPGQSRLLVGLSVAIVAVALLAGFLNYFCRAERSNRAGRACEAANQLYRRERLPEAIEQYRYALSISHRADHRLALGIALVKDGLYERSGALSERSPAPASEQRQGILALANALAAEQRFHVAILHYRKSILGTRDSDGAENRFRARAELIDVLTKAGRAADVRAELLALVADPPAEPALQKQAAHILLDHGVAREAADLYRQIIASGPPDAAE